MTDLPMACSLTPEQLAARRDELLPGLLRRARAYYDTPTGYRFELDGTPESYADLARVIGLERQCCRFLTFRLSLAPDLGDITLDISGPDGTRDFLRSLLP